MIHKFDFTQLKPRCATIWHSSDFHVYRQLEFWYSANHHLQFTPSRLFGLLCITTTPSVIGRTEVLQGYIVYRPCALELSIPQDVYVARRAVNTKLMQDWCNITLPWISVKPAKR